MNKQDFLDRQREIFDGLCEIARKKQKDCSGKIDDPFYNFNQYEGLNICSREQGILSRICDKLTRIIGALQGNKLQCESMQDSIFDMINYLVMRRREMLKPNEPKEALILVGGIADKPHDLAKRLKDCQSFPSERFQIINEIDLEKSLDKGFNGFRVLQWFRKLAFFDKFGDPFAFLADALTREQCFEQIEEVINVLNWQYPGIKITIIAHSLGTLAALGANIKVHNLITLASPLGWKGYAGRNWVEKVMQKRIIKDGEHAQAKNYYNFYSSNDFVGAVPIPPWVIDKVAGINHYKGTQCLVSHDWHEYMNCIDWSEIL